MSIRYYKSGDKEKIRQLYKKVFKKERSISHWEWKYIKNPKMTSPFILVYEEEGVILGHLALWETEAYMNGKVKKMALRVDTMVDPDARGKGIYGKLNQQMLGEAKKRDISYLYGFPASKAKDLLVKSTNGQYVGNISRYIIMLDPVTLAGQMFTFLAPLKPIGKMYKTIKTKGIRKSRLPHGWKVERVAHCDDRFDQLAAKMKSLKPILLKRDSAYLNWRFLQHPDNSYSVLAISVDNELKGYIIIKEEKTPFKHGQATVGSVVDWLAIDEEKIWDCLIEMALSHLKEADYIHTWLLPGNNGVKSLLTYGFKEKDKPMPLVIHNLESNVHETHNSMSDWWVTQGDVDSF